jgi:hypothetical protein
MATRPTDPETDAKPQDGGWVRSKRDIPADEEAVSLDSWPGEDDEDEPTKETESIPRGVIPPSSPKGQSKS